MFTSASRATVLRMTETERDLAAIQVSLKRALEEVRATSTGLALPQLGNLTIAETVEHAVRAHRRRTGSQVEVAVGDLPAQADVAVKIAIYRVIQEALANAWRHAGGVGQAVRVERDWSVAARSRCRIRGRDSMRVSCRRASTSDWSACASG